MAVVLKTYGEMLAETQTAISKVLAGQRYEVNGRSVWRADLEWLHKRENELIDKCERFGLNTYPGETKTVYGVVPISFGDA